MKQIQDARLRVITTDGQPVVLGSAGSNLSRVIVEDPDGVFVELAQS